MSIKLAIICLCIIVGILSISACSGADVVNAIVPKSGYTVHKNIAYGKESRHHLDIYTPNNPRPSQEVIVFFYGGSWKKGSKDDYRFVGQAFASKGYITVIADYRLYPEIRYPSFMQDSAAAFAWVYHNIATYGGNAKHIFLAGHSAGAYIAALLTLNEAYLKQAGAKREWIKGTIGIAGPYDFRPSQDPAVKDIFSTAEDNLTQPIHYVSPDLPPFLLVTGDEDKDVYPRNTYHLAKKLRHYDNHVREHIYKGVGHIGIILSLAHGFRGKAPLLEDIDAFIDEASNNSAFLTF